MWRVWYLSNEGSTPLKGPTTYLLTYISSFSLRSLRSHNIRWTVLVVEQNVLIFPLNKLSNLRECVDHDRYDYHRSCTTTPLAHSFLEL